jgi:hypothetical protein
MFISSGTDKHPLFAKFTPLNLFVAKNRPNKQKWAQERRFAKNMIPLASTPFDNQPDPKIRTKPKINKRQRGALQIIFIKTKLPAPLLLTATCIVRRENNSIISANKCIL